MKTLSNRQFIILCLLVVIGFCVLGIQNYIYHAWDKQAVDTMIRSRNHEHQLIMKKLGN